MVAVIEYHPTAGGFASLPIAPFRNPTDYSATRYIKCKVPFLLLLHFLLVFSRLTFLEVTVPCTLSEA